MTDRVPTAVLVTGASGSIGRPLIGALAARGVERIYVLTHADHSPIAGEDVRPVVGDVTAGADLGLSPADARDVAADVAGIIHAAADTGFGTPLDRARAVNAGGTRNVLAFASRCRSLDRIVALSTTHVAGRRTGDVLEQELEHGAGFVNDYEASKYEAELAIRAASGRVPVSVCRLSTVAGDSESGEVGRRGAIHQAVRLMYAGLVPMVPGREDSPVDLIALDHAVRAIAWLATAGFEAGRTWHLAADTDTIAAGELIDLTMACLAEYRPVWRKRAIARPAFVDLSTFELFRRSVNEAGDASLRESMNAVAHFAPQLAFPKRFDSTGCTSSLAIGGVTPPPIRQVWRRVVRRLVQPAVEISTEWADGTR